MSDLANKLNARLAGRAAAAAARETPAAELRAKLVELGWNAKGLAAETDLSATTCANFLGNKGVPNGAALRLFRFVAESGKRCPVSAPVSRGASAAWAEVRAVKRALAARNLTWEALVAEGGTDEAAPEGQEPPANVVNYNAPASAPAQTPMAQALANKLKKR